MSTPPSDDGHDGYRPDPAGPGTGWAVPQAPAGPSTDPGYPAPGHPSVPHPRPAALAGRMGPLGTAVIAVSALFAVLSWLDAWLAFRAQAVLDAGLARGEDLSDVVFPVDVVDLLEVVVLLVAWVLTSVWLGRGHAAARAAVPQAVRRSAVWVWIGWLVPVVSLWFPKQVVDDTWAVAAGRPAGRPPRGTGWWWGTWLAGILLSRYGGTPTATSTAASTAAAAAPSYGAGLRVITAIFLTVALVHWVRVVRGLSAAHDAAVAAGGVPRG